jgi:hypothetical protein
MNRPPLRQLPASFHPWKDLQTNQNCRQENPPMFHQVVQKRLPFEESRTQIAVPMRASSSYASRRVERSSRVSNPRAWHRMGLVRTTLTFTASCEGPASVGPARGVPHKEMNLRRLPSCPCPHVQRLPRTCAPRPPPRAAKTQSSPSMRFACPTTFKSKKQRPTPGLPHPAVLRLQVFSTS